LAVAEMSDFDHRLGVASNVRFVPLVRCAGVPVSPGFTTFSLIFFWLETFTVSRKKKQRASRPRGGEGDPIRPTDPR